MLKHHLNAFHQVTIILLVLTDWTRKEQFNLILIIVLHFTFAPIDFHHLGFLEVSAVSLVVVISVADGWDVGSVIKVEY